MELRQFFGLFGPVISEFRFAVQTTGTPETFTLPLEVTGNYDFHIEWGDVNSSDITLWNHADVTHSYATPGTYEIAITGTITGWNFNNGGDCTLYYETKSWGPFNPGNSGGAFYGCSNHTITATDIPDFTGVTTLENYFRTNTALTEIPSAASWDFTNIVNATNYLEGVTLTVANYNAIITSYSAQVPSGAYAFHGGNSKYTTGGAVLTARDAWVTKGWTITDGGENLGSELITVAADRDMSGANNWSSDSLGTFDINSTVANKMYMLGNGGMDYCTLTTFGASISNKFVKVSIKAKLNAGASTEIGAGATIWADVGSTFTFTPTGIEATYVGYITLAAIEVLHIGKGAGFNGIAFEIDDISMKECL